MDIGDECQLCLGDVLLYGRHVSVDGYADAVVEARVSKG